MLQINCERGRTAQHIQFRQCKPANADGVGAEAFPKLNRL